MFEAAKELHDRFLARRKSTCCRVLIRKFEFGCPEHIQQCITITGEVAADVIRLLERGIGGCPAHSLEFSPKLARDSNRGPACESHAPWPPDW